MKFIEPNHFTDPDPAARKLVEIANATEAVQDGRIYIELVNGAFLELAMHSEKSRAQVHAITRYEQRHQQPRCAK
jgi:hypothetical protein